jgi:hypothetical protein
VADDPATEKASLTKFKLVVQVQLDWPIERTPPTTIYLLPVLGGRNVFESNLVVSDLAAASKASLALIL